MINHRPPYQTNRNSGSAYIPLSIGARIGSALIDVLVVLAASPAVISGLQFVLGCDSQNCFTHATTWMVAFFAIIAYLLLFWIVNLATPGKIAFRAIIVDSKTGSNPTTWQFLKRALSLMASCVIVGLGFISIFSSPLHQAFHDKFSQTMVVRGRERTSFRKRVNFRFYVIATATMILVILLFFLVASTPNQIKHSFASLAGQPDAYLAGEQFVATCLSGRRQTPTLDRDLLEKHIKSAQEQINGSRGRRSSLEIARSSLNAALNMDPCNALTYLEYARYFERVAKIDKDPGEFRLEALHSIARAISVDPHYADAYVLQGFLMHLVGHNELATQALDRAEELGSMNPWLHINRGLIKRYAGDYLGAAIDYRAAIDSGTDNKKAIGVAMGGIAEYFKRAGQLAEAREVYSKWVEFDPESPVGHLKYSRFLLCYDDDPEHSLGEVAKTAKLAHGSDQIRYAEVMAANYVRQWARHILRGGLAAERMAPKLINQANKLADGTPIEVMSVVCPSGPAYEQVRSASARAASEQLTDHRPPRQQKKL